jgi:AbrB family looped-hinge helix DNA binding protein
MAIAQSRLTAQGQISVPAEVRRRLGLAPGSVIEWEEEAGKIVVRRAATASWDDIHKAIFPSGPVSPGKSVDEMNAGIRAHLRKKYGQSG